MTGSYNDFAPRTWEEMKGYVGDTSDFWIGLEDIHSKCPTKHSCDLTVFMKYRGSQENVY